MKSETFTFLPLLPVDTTSYTAAATSNFASRTNHPSLSETKDVNVSRDFEMEIKRLQDEIKRLQEDMRLKGTS
ncbi:hypothetical protein DL98DRAFT_580165 [Cadophora sp. DSE1049]|nr:hypothetical protein DL98DRAFT_580165 [Cadophora sp. DSE1049]